MNKRVAIGAALAVLGLVVVTTIGVLVTGGDDRRAGALSGSGAAKWQLRMNGQWVAELVSLRGCSARREVTQALETDDQGQLVTNKSVGVRRYEACELTLAWAHKPLRDWIKQMLQGQQQPKLLELSAINFDGQERVRLELEQTRISKVVFPELVAQSGAAPFELALVLQPERIVRIDPASGQGSSWPKPIPPLRNHFRVRFEGQHLQQATEVGAISVSQQLVEQDLDGTGEISYSLGKLALDDLSLTTQRTPITGVEQWYRSFVVQGQNEADQEKTIEVELLNPQTAATIFTLTLNGVGVYSAADNDGVTQRTYSLYAEAISYAEPTTSTGTPPTTTQATTTQATTTQQTTTAQTTTEQTTTVQETTPPPMPLEATIVPVAGKYLLDGETFTISDGVNEPTTFEFDLDGEAKGVQVKIAEEMGQIEVAKAIAEAIDGVGEELGMSAVLDEEQAAVKLQSERGEDAGEEKILEFVEDERFRVSDADPATEEGGLPPPAEVKATTGEKEGQVTLAWSASEGALGYLVLHATEPGGEFVELEKTESTEVALIGLESGVTHYFVVRALDGERESRNSPQAAAEAR